MNRKLLVLNVVALLVLVAGFAQVSAQQRAGRSALSSAFTYQGRLMDGDAPAEGEYAMMFRLYDAATGDGQIGADVAQTLTVSEGLFVAQLDFGASAFGGEQRWLEIEVAGTILTPRQALTAAPHALYALQAGQATTATTATTALSANHAETATTATTATSALNAQQAETATTAQTATLALGANHAETATTATTATSALNAQQAETATTATTATTALGAPWSGITGVPADLADGDEDTNTEYTAGAGLSLSGTTFSLDPSAAQQRVSGTCAAGSSISSIAADGSVSCESDDDTDTTYAAGTGLNLSGTTLSANTSYLQRRVTGTCSTGSMISTILENGTVFCQTDDDTTYAAGTGLSLSGTTFNINPTYMQRRVSGTCAIGSSIRSIAQDGTVTCETDDDIAYTASAGLVVSGTVLSSDPTYLQRRVSGGCAVGSSISAVAEDGTVTCEADDNTTYTAGTGLALSGTTFDVRSLPRPGFDISTVDSAGNVGGYSTIMIGSDGLPLISYHSGTTGALRVAHCNDMACTSATISAVDIAGIGSESSLTIGSDGLGLISYTDTTNAADGNLKVAHCSNIVCSSVTTATLDTVGSTGYAPSITIGSDGLGIISYANRTNGDLRVAHCNDLACTSVTSATLDATDNVGYDTSITIGSDGLGIISYHDATAENLKVAHCNNVACTGATVTTIDSITGTGYDTSIAIGSDGLAIISYWAQWASDVKVAHCSNVLCTSATITTIDDVSAGFRSSITIGSDGLALISYSDRANNNLKVAHCSNVACTSVVKTTVNSTADQVGYDTSITIGVDGLGIISYYNTTTDDLEVLHCSNTLCTPHVRRR